MTEERFTYLISADDVKGGSFVNYNVTDDLIADAIRIAQDTYLRDVIGCNLLMSVKGKVYRNITSGEAIEEKYLTLIDDYIVPYLVAEAQVQICEPLALKLRNVGVTSTDDTNIRTADIEAVKRLENSLKTFAVDKVNRLIDFLNANEFEELQGCKCHKLNKKANIGLWLK